MGLKHLNENVVLGSQPPDNWTGRYINVNVVVLPKTVRKEDNCGAGSWRQDSASAFPQYMKKLVTCYRRAKENYLEERILEDGGESVEIG